MANVINMSDLMAGVPSDHEAYDRLRKELLDMMDQGVNCMLLLAMTSQLAGTLAAAVMMMDEGDSEAVTTDVMAENFAYGRDQATTITQTQGRC